MLHQPAITLPGFTDAAGLPVGIQLVGARDADGALLAVARWFEDVLARALA
jgi:Asp-tRNA(Asn)/Glu-tRNA(Gln) amidotransferase A subunit family amidase